MFYAVATVFEAINVYQLIVDRNHMRAEEYYLGLIYFPILCVSLLFTSVSEKYRPPTDNSTDKICSIRFGIVSFCFNISLGVSSLVFLDGRGT